MAKRKTNRFKSKPNVVAKDVEIFEESIFTISSGRELKCFPVDKTILNGDKFKLKKEYEHRGINLDAPIVKVKSVAGTADFEIELDSKEACKIDGDEEETNRRLDLFKEWQQALEDFNSELSVKISESMMVWGLGNKSYFGTPQPGGLVIPKDFEEKMVSLGQEWPDDYRSQMFLYISLAVFTNPGRDGRNAATHIQLAGIAGSATMNQYEELKETIDATFRNRVAELDNKEDISSQESSEGSNTEAED